MGSGGITKSNIIAVIACVVVVIVLFTTMSSTVLGNHRTQKDMAQLKGIYLAFSTFAEYQKDGRFPIPGQINRFAIDFDSFSVDNQSPFGSPTYGCGPGKSDFSLNQTAWLHSYMIGENYYNPSMLISHNEKNPLVVAKGDQKANKSEIPYNYEAVSPAIDSFWDPLFSGDISGQGRAEGTIEGGVEGVCHVSYANMALCGERLKFWKSGDYKRVIMSSRGPEDGAGAGNDFTLSPTLKLYGDANKWEGIYVTADGATHYAETMFFGEQYTPVGESTPIPDNAFSADFTDYKNTNSLGNPGGASNDIWMVLNVASTETDVKTAWDTLVP